jgi:starch synthase (maltosyl-transferring)
MKWHRSSDGGKSRSLLAVDVLKVKSLPKPVAGRSRVIIENVKPAVDGGRFAAKRIVGDRVTVSADIFGDGHDHVSARLLFRELGQKNWQSVPMEPLGNDRWSAGFVTSKIGRYQYTLAAGVDHFDTWRSGFEKKLAAGQDMSVELLNGAALVKQAASWAKGKDADRLRTWARALRSTPASAAEESIPEPASQPEPATGSRAAGATVPAKAGKAAKTVKPSTPSDAPPLANLTLADLLGLALDPQLAEVMARYPDIDLETRYERELEIIVDREKARFSTWYELFPRSTGPSADVHGTFRDVENHLDYVQRLGFDVLYMPPIHPIGRSFRKGKNNSVTAGLDEVGSPWAIGAAEGGHTDILPELGTLADFQHLRAEAESRGIELALDIAFQCAPDHPWVKEHPGWFKKRADGTIQYAENPPKKYQDIYPIDFESKDWQAMWDGLRDVFLYWASQGVRIFRVDNPHTKAFGFWEWAITSIKQQYPDVLFLAEAFTRPRVMEQLAKLGFSQSYTYFTWRTTKAELETYGRELTQPSLLPGNPGSDQWEFFRPNFWPNTPDILPLNIQSGGRAAFALRLVLAATMNGNYGVYGAAYELLEDAPFKPGGEEYLNSEKYEIKHWDRESPTSIAPLIETINRARKENPALQSMDRSLYFHAIDNEQLICYSKRSPDGSNVILTIVNLDPLKRQTGWVYLWMEQLGLTDESAYTVEDLLTGATYQWRGPGNYVALDPAVTPAHVFRVTAV